MQRNGGGSRVDTEIFLPLSAGGGRYPTEDNLVATPVNRRYFLLLLPAVVVAILIARFRHTVSLERQPIEKPIQFLHKDAIKGGDDTVKSGATLLIGEIHGTWEIPIAVASLVRQAVTADNEVILCVEVSAAEQESFNRFLNSDGSDRAIEALLDTPFWIGQDGRASVGMFAMLELVRRLHSSGHKVHVHAIDVDLNGQPGEQSAYYRDQTMAENLLRVRKGSPKAILIALAGNIHTKTVKGAPWDDNYLPMGWFVSQAIPDTSSFNIQIAGGSAWVMTEQGAGERTFRGKEQGDDPFLLINKTLEIGYDGVFYIGRISAAKPVFTVTGG